MSTFATNLTGQESPIYLSTMPTCLACPPFHPVEQPPKPRIVIHGAGPRRRTWRVLPWRPKHNNTGSPSFEEQPAAYTQAQLQVFASDDATTTSATRCATSRAITHAEGLEETAEYDASQASDVLKAVG
jgi:hypothetical protein